MDLFEVRRKVLVEQYLEFFQTIGVMYREVADPFPLEGEEYFI